MPVFKLEPWGEKAEVEMCGTTFCIELKDKEHRINVFYHEHGDRGGLTLDISLQKKEGYKEYVKKMVEFDLPPVPLNEGSPFFSTYEAAVKLFKEGKHVNLVAKWEHEGVWIGVTVILDNKRVYMLFRAVCGPHKLYYQSDIDTKEHDRWLRHFLINAAGLYLLFREYIKTEELGQPLQEKT
jgi:hypothetical protein